MSMPHTNLRCNQCGHTGGTLQLHSPFVYHFRGRDVRISKSLGYCMDCDNFRAMEDFDSVEEALAEIDELSHELLPPINRVVAFLLAPFRMSRQHENIRKLQTRAYYLGIAALRQGDERCLTCLGRNITRVKSRNLSDFKHPNCGGEFIAELSDIRFHLSNESIYFDVIGSKLSKR